MARSIWQASIVSETGDIFAGAQVDIVSESTGLPVNLYDSRTGGTNIGNPVFADADGFVEAYTDPDRIRVVATSGAFSRTWRNIQLVSSGPTDSEDTPTNAGLGTAATVNTGTAANNVPLNSQLGSASTINTGSASNEIPLNSNLGDASLITKQTSATDTETGRAVLTNALSDNGGPIWTTTDYQPESVYGSGVPYMMYNNSGGTIGAGASVAGSSLYTFTVLGDGTLGGNLATASGTWLNTSGSAISSGQGCQFVRIA